MAQVSGSKGWDLLRRLYFHRNLTDAEGKWDAELVAEVLSHAKRVIAHPSRPTVTERDSFLRYPNAELALEESIEENPLLMSPEDFLVDRVEERPFSCVTLLDCSSSMSGDKHLLASIAVAVLLLEVQPENAGLVVFASNATAVKNLGSQERAETTILNFLRAAPRGFTNIAAGLESGLKQLSHIRGRRRVALLATDGRATEGEDPMEFARQFDFLVVLHLHGPGSHIEASRALAQAGHGLCLEVEDYTELPHRMYDAIKYLARI